MFLIERVLEQTGKRGGLEYFEKQFEEYWVGGVCKNLPNNHLIPDEQKGNDISFACLSPYWKSVVSVFLGEKDQSQWSTFPVERSTNSTATTRE